MSQEPRLAQEQSDGVGVFSTGGSDDDDEDPGASLLRTATVALAETSRPREGR